MKKLYSVLCIGVLFLTIIARLYRIDAPVADWHSFRQTDTASVAQLFVDRGIDIFHPRYQDLSNIQSGKDNPEGWRMVEVPLYQATAVILHNFVPSLTLDISLRVTTIGAAVGTVFIIMLLLYEMVSWKVALLAGFTYAVLPYSVFYGRSILPETFAVFWAMLSVYCMYTGTVVEKKSWIYILIAAVSGSLSLLIKPTAGFLLLPIPYLLLRRYRISSFTVISGLVYAFIVIFPIWWWRGWIAQFPEGIPVFDWLFNKGDIRFKGAWFHWLFAERLGKMILGYWGLIPFGLGMLISPSKKEGMVTHLFGLGCSIYLSVFAAGNVQHDYYQIILLPVVSIYVAKGLDFLLSYKGFSIFTRYGLLAVSMMFAIAFSWYTMRSFYWINRPEIITAGRNADELLPKDAKVIAPYNGDTTFLYQTKRQGWPLGFDIDEKIAMGATHYVTVSPTDNDWETKTLAEKYTVLVRNESYAIIDLTKLKTQ